MDNKDIIFDVEKIRAAIPHRYPFLLVDRILELEQGKRCVGLKNVTVNEPFFQGHFPGQAVMPGVLIIESLAQVGGVLIMALGDYHNKLAMLAGVDKARFKKPVVPGDTMINEVIIDWFKRGIGKATATARVNGEVVAEAEITFALVDRSTT